MSQQGINDVASCIDIYEALGSFKSELKKRLENDIIDDINDIEFIFLGHICMTNYLDRCSARKESLIAKWRASKKRLGHIVPFASSIQEFIGMSEVWKFICNPHTSDTDTMNDLCDGKVCKEPSFPQQYPNALQIIEPR